MRLNQQAYLAAKRFNERVQVGDTVSYVEVAGDPNVEIFETQTPAEVLSGHTAVVWLHGKSGCVAVSHCKPCPLELLSSENVQTLLFEGHVGIERATKIMQDEYGCEFPAPIHGWMRYVDVPEGEDADWWRAPCAQHDKGAEPVTYSQRQY